MLLSLLTLNQFEKNYFVLGLFPRNCLRIVPLTNFEEQFLKTTRQKLKAKLYSDRTSLTL